MTKLVISLFAMISYLAFNACIQKNKLEEIPDLTGKSCGDCSVGQFSVRSKLACSIACSVDTRCVSFSYVKQNKHCTLRDCIPTTNCCTVSSNGDRHYRLIGRMSSRYTYDATIGGWYRIECKAMTNWLEAQTTCKCEGGHLLVLRSQTENEWIQQKIVQTRNELGSALSRYWADGARASGTWRLYDETRMPWSNWDGDHGGNCNAVGGLHNHNMACSYVCGYVCQKNVP